MERKEFCVLRMVVQVCVSLDCKQHRTPGYTSVCSLHNLVYDHQSPLLSVGMHGPLLAEVVIVRLIYEDCMMDLDGSDYEDLSFHCVRRRSRTRPGPGEIMGDLVCEDE